MSFPAFMPQDSMLSQLTTCSFMVMEYFNVEIGVSLLSRCAYVLGPCGETRALVNDCVFLPPPQKNKAEIILKRILLS